MIFVGNIPIDSEAWKLHKFFKEHGKIEKIWFWSFLTGHQASNHKLAFHNKEIGVIKQTKNAYVLFETKEAAENALVLNGELFEGHHLRVDREEK